MKELTKQETKVSHFVALGFSEKEIADKLYISIHTVHAHTRNIRKKLNARNIADITRMYILSLDKPQMILKSFLFLAIQVSMIVSAADIEIRRTNRSKTRTTAKITRHV